MKRIEFIQPVESMRGSFGNKQDLKYPANDNKAFDAPDDKRSYARNYQPTFIGAKIASTGLKYFSVKTKTAVRNTAAWRMAAALQGGTGAIVGALLVQSTTAVVNVRNYFNNVVLAADPNVTFRKWASPIIRAALAAKQAKITFYTGVEVDNPWNSPTQDITINANIIVKFFVQLGFGSTFTIDGKKCASWDGVDDWSGYVQSSLNVLGVTMKTIGETQYPTLDGKYIIDAGGTIQTDSDEFDNGDEFTTTSEEPQP